MCGVLPGQWVLAMPDLPTEAPPTRAHVPYSGHRTVTHQGTLYQAQYMESRGSMGWPSRAQVPGGFPKPCWEAPMQIFLPEVLGWVPVKSSSVPSFPPVPGSGLGCLCPTVGRTAQGRTRSHLQESKPKNWAQISTRKAHTAEDPGPQQVEPWLVLKLRTHGRAPGWLTR